MAGARPVGGGAHACGAGNATGGARLLRRGAGVLAGLDAPYGIDLPGLVEWAGALAGRVEAGAVVDAAAEAPRLAAAPDGPPTT